MNRRQFVIAASVGAAALASRPLALTSAGSRRVALVTADTEAHVAAVDLDSGRAVRRIATARLPRSIERVGGTALIAHSELGRVTLIDGGSLVPRALDGRFDEPRYTAAHPDGRHAFVTDSGLGQVVVVDVVRGVVVARASVGGPARHVTLSPDGRRLWTSLGSKARAVAIVDVSVPRSPRLLGTIRPPFLAHDVVFTPSGDRVWLTSGDRGAIAVYDASSRRVLRRLAADAPPQHIAFGESGRLAYVASGDDGTVRTHDLDGRLLRSRRVPVGSYNVTRGQGRVITPSLERGTLCVLNRDGVVLRTVQVASAAHDACVLGA